MIGKKKNEGEIPIEVTTVNEGEVPAGATTANNTAKAPKQKFYKKKWFWIVIAVLLVFGLFGGNGNDDKATTEDDSVAVEEQTQEETTSSENESVVMTDDILVATLNTSFEGQGTWKIAGDRHFAFYPEGDLADAFTLMGTYYMQYGEIPSEVKDSYDYMVTSLKDLSKTMSDTTGEACALSVVNPSNTDNVLMTFIDGATLYNAFEE